MVNSVHWLSVGVHCSLFLQGGDMPKDKTDSRQRILLAAEEEFLTYGYPDASMRRMAKSAGITASALYKHFENKEAIFSALVEPALKALMDLGSRITEDYYRDMDFLKAPGDYHNEGEMTKAMACMYDHFSAMDLLVNKAYGTRYEHFQEAFVRQEEEVTRTYIKALQDKGIGVKEVDPLEFHLLVTGSVSALFLPVVHRLDRQAALAYAKTLESFYDSAWKHYFGLE